MEEEARDLRRQGGPALGHLVLEDVHHDDVDRVEEVEARTPDGDEGEEPKRPARGEQQARHGGPDRASVACPIPLRRTSVDPFVGELGVGEAGDGGDDLEEHITVAVVHERVHRRAGEELQRADPGGELQARSSPEDPVEPTGQPIERAAAAGPVGSHAVDELDTAVLQHHDHAGHDVNGVETGVHRQHDIPYRLLDAHHERGVVVEWPGERVDLDVAYAPLHGLQNLPGSVGGAVVDNDELEIRELRG